MEIDLKKLATSARTRRLGAALTGKAARPQWSRQFAAAGKAKPGKPID